MPLSTRPHDWSVARMLMLAALMGTCLLLWEFMAGTALAQDPRPTLTFTPLPPTLTPTPTATVMPSEPTAEPRSRMGYVGPTLHGRVVNLITGQGVSDATVVFKTGDASVEKVTNEVGEYAFDLSTANGVLNVVPPSGSQLKPVTRDVAVQTRTGVETMVNLGVSPNGSGTPPLIPLVKVSPASVRAGDPLTITVMVKNTLPEQISRTMVTMWLPEGLAPVRISSSTGNPYFSDNLAVVELGRLDVGSGALVEIVAQADHSGALGSALQNTVSLFYVEEVAAQAQAQGGLNGSAPTVLPATGVGLPVIGAVLIFVVVLVGWLRRRVVHTVSLR